MKNRKITLHDGTAATINDADWRSVVNVKQFDDSMTEIIRLNRHVNDSVLLLQVMRSSNAKKADAEHWEPVMMGADPRTIISRAAQKCAISDETLQMALAAL